MKRRLKFYQIFQSAFFLVSKESASSWPLLKILPFTETLANITPVAVIKYRQIPLKKIVLNSILSKSAAMTRAIWAVRVLAESITESGKAVELPLIISEIKVSPNALPNESMRPVIIPFHEFGITM